jgi:hypothetical protein
LAGGKFDDGMGMGIELKFNRGLYRDFERDLGLVFRGTAGLG